MHAIDINGTNRSTNLALNYLRKLNPVDIQFIFWQVIIDYFPDLSKIYCERET